MDSASIQEFIQDPHPLYAELRQRDVIHRAVIPPGVRVWVVTDYQECKRVSADYQTFSSDNARLRKAFVAQAGGDPEPAEPATGIERHMLSQLDPPEHSRLRGIVGKAFTRRVHGLKPIITAAVDELIAGLRGRAAAELVEDFAFPLAARLISVLSGIDPGDQELFSGWLSDLRLAENDSVPRLTAYIDSRVGGDNCRLADGLLSDLCRASSPDDALTHDEFVSTGVLLAIAGTETTTSLISSAVLTLLTWPGQRDLLRSRPELTPKAVEEVLRYEGPINMGSFRVTTADVRVGRSLVPAGEIVLVSSASANRDETRFPGGSTFDIARSAGGHLAFGHGIHVCLGAPFVRITAAIALTRIFEAFPDLRLRVPVQELKWQDTVLMRGLKALPVLL